MEPVHFPLLVWLAWLLLVIIGVIRSIVVPHRRKQLGFAVAFVAISPFVVSAVLCMSLDKREVLQILAKSNIVPKDDISISGRYRTDNRVWVKELTETKGGNWMFEVHLTDADMKALQAQFHPQQYQGMVALAKVTGLKHAEKYIMDFQESGKCVRWSFFYDKLNQLRSCRMVIYPSRHVICIYYAANSPLWKWLMI